MMHIQFICVNNNVVETENVQHANAAFYVLLPLTHMYTYIYTYTRMYTYTHMRVHVMCIILIDIVIYLITIQ